MNDVYIIGAGMIKFGKYPDKSVKQMTAEALDALFKDVSVDRSETQAAWFANSGWGVSHGQHCIRGQVALAPYGIQGIPIINVENACAGGSTAFHGAWMGVASGLYDVTLAVGVEKVYHPNELLMFSSFLGGLDVDRIGESVKLMREIESKIKIKSRPKTEKKRSGKGLKRLVKMPVTLLGRLRALPNMAKNAIIIRETFGRETFRILIKEGFSRNRSAFMDLYSIAARMHMEKYGSTQRQLAVISSKNHFHSSLNPLAQFQREMTVEEVLDDKLISFPLTRSMCAPIGDGAAAALLCSGEYLKKLNADRAVRVLASVVGAGRYRDWDDIDIGERLAGRAYNAAGVSPKDIDVAEVHDATAFGELHHTETLGFCGKGEGGILVESGATRLGGRIPINTSGGLESRGHPIAATGLAQIHEIVMQLRGEAGRRQAEGARLGLTQNGGGFLGIEEAAMAIHILGIEK